MDLNQLEAFSAVMTLGSVTRAGHSLGRSQPAISKALQDLEHEIGYPLFDRNGPRITPTDKAFLLYEEVERSLVGLNTIKERAKEIFQDTQQPLHLIATPALAATLLPAAIQSMQTQMTLGPIELRSASAEQIAYSVLHRTVTLGLTSLPISHRSVDLHWIGEAPCVAVIHKNHPLADKNIVSVSDLKTLPLITLSNRYRLRQRIDTALGEYASLNVHIETNTSLNAIMAARAGLGIALVEPVTAYGIPQEDLVIKPLEIRIPFYFGVISPYGKPLNQIANTLLNTIETVAHNMLHGFIKHEAAQHDNLL